MAVLQRLGYTAALFALGSALALGALSGCRDGAAPTPRELPAAEPTQAVAQLVHDLRHDDLVAYSQHAVPPALHADLRVAWQQGRSRWPLTALPLHARLPGLLATLSAPGAEKTLLSTYRRQFAGAGRDLHSAAATLGLFAAQYLQREGDYSSDERAHYLQLAAALGQWGQRAPLGDVAKAKAAIPRLVSAARLTGLGDRIAPAGRVSGRAGTASAVERGRAPVAGAAAGAMSTGSREEGARLAALGMERSLRRLAPFLARVKQVLVGYGLDTNAALDGMRITLVERTGDTAQVRLRYRIADRAIDARVRLERIDGQWYLSDALRRARAQAESGQVEPVLAGP